MTKQVVKEPINLKDVYNILDLSIDAGAFVEEWEGVLNDNYVISGMAEVEVVGGEEPTDHIIILAEFASSWHNDLYMIRTNDDSVADYYTELFNKH